MNKVSFIIEVVGESQPDEKDLHGVAASFKQLIMDCITNKVEESYVKVGFQKATVINGKELEEFKKEAGYE